MRTTPQIAASFGHRPGGFVRSGRGFGRAPFDIAVAGRQTVASRVSRVPRAPSVILDTLGDGRGTRGPSCLFGTLPFRGNGFLACKAHCAKPAASHPEGTRRLVAGGEASRCVPLCGPSADGGPAVRGAPLRNSRVRRRCRITGQRRASREPLGDWGDVCILYEKWSRVK
jgi:hypothetical protein